VNAAMIAGSDAPAEACTTAGIAYRLGPVDQIPYGEGRAFAVGGHQVAVFRKRDGSLRALSAVCPHKGGPIADGQTDNRVVLCPLHMNAFELDTGCSTTGAAPLRTYPVYLDDGEIVVHVS
jgi:nitrite reductase (NADH) small subunit